MRFLEFIDFAERIVDPVKLADRVSRRYGKKSYYSKYMRASKGKHIPLTSYNGRLANAAQTRYESYLTSLGVFNRETQEEGLKKLKNNQKTEKFNIKDLIASQPFNRYDDTEKSKEKIKDTDPKHIHIITFKGNHIISDGHHAVMAAKLRGEKTVNADHTNLDVLYPSKNK
jgi:hypothetical protein